MMSPARAEQRTRFFDTYRSYVINYNLGKDLVRQYVEVAQRRARSRRRAGTSSCGCSRRRVCPRDCAPGRSRGTDGTSRITARAGVIRGLR